MKRADICASDDHEAVASLLQAIQDLGGVSDGGDDALGVGLHRFVFPAGELSVFQDAWTVDIAGPDDLVDWVLEKMRS